MGVVREAEQHEKAYQKQDGVFHAKKRILKKSKKGLRFYKNVGLGFTTPKTAIDGHYVDKKCPFTGNVSIRGRILKGLVVSAGKMKNTLVMRRDYLHYIKKYRRYEKRHRNVTCHVSPCFEAVKEGDIVTVGQCRPLSKTIRFNVLEHEPCTNTSISVKKQFKQF